MLLDEFLNGEKSWPNGPDGWVFAPLAICGFLNAWDDHAYCRRGDGHDVVWFNSSDNLSSLVGPEPSRPSIEAAAFDRTKSAIRFAEDRIVGASFAGNLKAACRLKTGGGLMELPTAAWGQDDIREMLYSCSIDPERPYDRASATHWLFFEERSLGWEIDSARLGMGLEPIHQRAHTLLVDPLEWPGPGLDEAARREAAGSLENFQRNQEKSYLGFEPEEINQVDDQPEVCREALRGPVSDAALTKWFRERVKEFEGYRPPTWDVCHVAAKKAFPDRRVTKDKLLKIRRLVATDWRPGRR